MKISNPELLIEKIVMYFHILTQDSQALFRIRGFFLFLPFYIKLKLILRIFFIGSINQVT